MPSDGVLPSQRIERLRLVTVIKHMNPFCSKTQTLEAPVGLSMYAKNCSGGGMNLQSTIFMMNMPQLNLTLKLKKFIL